MHIVLPKESDGRNLESIYLLHPSTRQPARFLLDQSGDAPHSLYELTRVGSNNRSALIGDRVDSDGSLVVATPIHPLLMILGVLFDNRNRPLPLDTLLDIGSSTSSEVEGVPEELVIPHMNTVCDTENGLFRLNIEKLKNFLETRIARVRAGLPPLVKAEVTKAVMPLNPNEEIPQALRDAAEDYAAVSFLTSSWLNPALGDWLLNTYDFSQLEQAALKLREQQAALNSMQFNETSSTSSKRGPNVPKLPAKRPKLVSIKNNASILDMFKKK